MKPSELYTLIESRTGELLADNASDDEIAEYLAELVDTIESHERVTTVTLLNELEPAEVAIFRAALQQIARENLFADAVREAIAGRGVLLNDPRAQAFVETMRPVIVELAAASGLDGDEITDHVAAIGIKRIPVFDEPPTAANVSAAREWNRLNQAFTAAVSRGRDVLANGGTWDDAVAEFDE